MGKMVKPIKDENLELDLIEYLRNKDERIYIFYLMLRYTGFRASDILPLKVRDIEGNRLIIREKKTESRPNKKARKILIHSDLKTELNHYIKDKESWEVLFPNNRGNNTPLSYTQAYRILKAASKKVGINDFGTHSGRKTCAYHIFMNTKNLREVQNFLMHENVMDTIRYVGIEQEVRDSAINKIDSPLAKIRREKFNVKNGSV